MRFPRPQFSMRVLLILMTVAGIACWFGARVVHRRIIASRPLVWKEITRENIDELAKHDRALVVWGADWDISSTTKFRMTYTDQPEVRLAVYDRGCSCFYVDLTDEHFLNEFMDRFPSIRQGYSHVLWLEHGKESTAIRLPK